jgi:ABC-type multidrug transport system fused ATPase/permease subunit
LSECIDTTYEELENKDELYDYIEDLFYNIDTVQSTPNGFKNELDVLLKFSNNSKLKEQEAINCVNTKQYEGYFSNIIVFVIMIYTIYRLHTDNKLANSQVTSTVLALTGLFENMYEITYYIPEVTNKLGVLKSNEQFVKNLLSVRHNKYNNAEIVISTFSIEFLNISFYYDAKNIEENIENPKGRMILNNFSCVIPENQITCVYGKSGSGKTTFARLIFGIEKPLEGIIKIGGEDISKYSITSIRNYISYVNQNTSNLFNATIYKNIIYGYKDSEELRERIMNIFIKFNFYDIFKSLDQDKEMWSFLDSNVGKLGENVSGGQKEIIFLLRLEINDFTKIIILDEPSAALDQITRQYVVQYILYLKNKGKTILLITHDNFYKNICDNMLVFSNQGNPT